MKYSIENSFRIKFKRGDLVACKVVAVIGGSNDWAAYYGPASWDDEEIARVGDKISESAARRLFESLDTSGLYYRP